jgi:hypothetical protein
VFYTICTSFIFLVGKDPHCIILSFELDAGSPLLIAQIFSGRSSAEFSKDGRLEGDIDILYILILVSRNAEEGSGLLWDGSKKEGA